MTLRPARIRDLAEVHPDDAVLYDPDPAGGEDFILNAALAARADALVAAHDAAERAREGAVIDGHLRGLLATAGVDPLLVTGALALWREMSVLRLVGDDVYDDRGVPLDALFEAWQTGAGRAFLAAASGRRQAAPAVGGSGGGFAAALRRLH